jgi:hypothetical protein
MTLKALVLGVEFDAELDLACSLGVQPAQQFL